MISFAVACQEVGYDPNNTIPKPDYAWVAYKDGRVAGISTVDERDAIRQFGTRIVERVELNAADRNVAFQAQRNLAQRAADYWLAQLRAEYSYLSQPVFDRCYTEAYSRGHSAGYDEVANCMPDVVNFALDILEISR